MRQIAFKERTLVKAFKPKGLSACGRICGLDLRMRGDDGSVS